VSSSTRHRTFTGVFYPESCPENFREIIDGWHVPAALVLHDQDEKKPHYHLLLLFTGKKSVTQARELMRELGSELVEPAYDTRAAGRYLLHLDHPKKHQYPVSALESFSGANAADLTAPVTDLTPEILDFVREQGLVSYSDLVNYCRDHRDDWSRCVMGRSVFWSHYLRSSEWTSKRDRGG
jgi:hypothetical protein